MGDSPWRPGALAPAAIPGPQRHRSRCVGYGVGHAAGSADSGYGLEASEAIVMGGMVWSEDLCPGELTSPRRRQLEDPLAEAEERAGWYRNPSAPVTQAAP